MNKVDKISVCIIGNGYWGRKFIDYIMANPYFELAQIADSKTDLEEIWQNEEIEAVFIMVPNEFHYELCMKALEHNKHVFCEKPLALTTIECLNIKNLAEEKNKVVVTDFIYTFSKALDYIERFINDGSIGDLQSVHFSTKHLGRFYSDNVYTLLATHLLSVLDMFYPLNELIHTKISLTKHFDNVETGSIFSFSDDIFTSQIDVSLNYPEKETVFTFYGDRGTIVYNPRIEDSLKVTQYTREPWVVADKLKKNKTTIFKFDEINNIKYAVNYFAFVIQERVESNIRRAIRVTKVLENL